MTTKQSFVTFWSLMYTSPRLDALEAISAAQCAYENTMPIRPANFAHICPASESKTGVPPTSPKPVRPPPYAPK